MRRLAVLLVMVASAPLLRGQTIPGIITITPQNCVWHSGDNPAWVAPNLDDAGWRPYTEWKLNTHQPRSWVRCHADLSALGGMQHPALQVSLYAAYQLYVDGALIGSAGDIRSGRFSMNTIRSFALPAAALHPATIALRVTSRLVDLLPADALPPLELSAGSASALRDRRARRLLAQSTPHLFLAASFSFIGVAGLILFGLFLSERDRREYLLLSVMSVSLAGIYLDYLLAAALVPFSCTAYLSMFAGSALALAISRPVFCFVLAQRRVPAIFWILIALGCILYVAAGAGAFLPAAPALRLTVFRRRDLIALCNLALAASSTAPFFAFWPYTRLTRRMRSLAGLCLVLGASVIVLHAVFSTAWGSLPGIPDLASRWGPVVSEVEACIMFCVLAALFALLFREHRQTAEERATLAGEMQAAREIQRMIAPATVEPAPGLHIEVAFRPMREVGGDFYSCRILPGDRQRILIGDVSGKGAAAAMTAAVLLGASQRRENESPAALLRHLNFVMADLHVSGFATCLCAELSAAGSLTLANAGHLPPYRNGEEVRLPPGLPLGITADAEYTETALPLAPHDALTFLSDGVVEARNDSGELFGFERTRAISANSAEAIAAAAQAFGQEDDITVLSLTFTAAEVLHA
jgi:phosphoserine phosphatase RsbU/P